MLFKLHQDSYIDDTWLPTGSTISPHPRHVPGPHWQPMDDEAKAACAQHKVKFTGFVPDVLPRLERELAALQLKNQQVQLHPESAGMIAQAVVEALARAGKLAPGPDDDSAEPEKSSGKK